MSHAVIAFGRMNPPTTGHEKMIHAVHDHAKSVGGHAEVIASHSHDKKKNPVPQDKKMGYLKKVAPKGVKVTAASKEHPSIFHHAARLHAEGHKHLTVMSDKSESWGKSLKANNGKKGPHGYYNFKSITMKSSGKRDPKASGTEGMSGTKMRAHAKAGDHKSFKAGLPKALHPHAHEIMKHINEETKRETQKKALKAFLSDPYNRDKQAAVHKHFPGSKPDKEKLRDALTRKEEMEQQDEALSLAMRVKKKLHMRRNRPKLKRMKRLYKSRKVPEKNLRKRSAQAAIRAVRKRVAGKKGQQYSKLTAASKQVIDKKVKQRQKIVQRLAKRMLPRARKAELMRLSKVREDVNETAYVVPGAGLTKSHPDTILHKAPAPDETKTIMKKKNAKSKIGDLPSKVTEQDLNALFLKSVKSGHDFETIIEVYIRGIESFNEERSGNASQQGFARVNSFISKGAALEEDADLLEYQTRSERSKQVSAKVLGDAQPMSTNTARRTRSVRTTRMVPRHTVIRRGHAQRSLATQKRIRKKVRSGSVRRKKETLRAIKDLTPVREAAGTGMFEPNTDVVAAADKKTKKRVKLGLNPEVKMEQKKDRPSNPYMKLEGTPEAAAHARKVTPGQVNEVSVDLEHPSGEKKTTSGKLVHQNQKQGWKISKKQSSKDGQKFADMMHNEAYKSGPAPTIGQKKAMDKAIDHLVKNPKEVPKFARSTLRGVPTKKKVDEKYSGPVITATNRASVEKAAADSLKGKDKFYNQPTKAVPKRKSDGDCFANHAPVLMADGSTKAMVEVEIGDKVMGKGGVVNDVLGFYIACPARTGPPSRTLYGFNGHAPFVTECHPFMTKQGWGCFDPETFKTLKPEQYQSIVDDNDGEELIKIEENKKLLYSDGNWEVVKDVVKDEEYTDKVFNLSVSGDKTFTVHDYIVHNKNEPMSATEKRMRRQGYTKENTNLSFSQWLEAYGSSYGNVRAGNPGGKSSTTYKGSKDYTRIKQDPKKKSDRFGRAKTAVSWTNESFEEFLENLTSMGHGASMAPQSRVQKRSKREQKEDPLPTVAHEDMRSDQAELKARTEFLNRFSKKREKPDQKKDSKKDG